MLYWKRILREVRVGVIDVERMVVRREDGSFFFINGSVRKIRVMSG